MPETTVATVRQVVLDPEGEFGSLADRYGHVALDAARLGYCGARGHDAFIQVDGRGGMTFFRVGKARAGRTPDGAVHDGMPEVRRA